jgi:ABC-type Fe3+-hydroxamate transport system substrate-binding protein
MAPGSFIDQMGRSLSMPEKPTGVISLVPSQTEFLLDIGAPVVGRTKFCVHPRERVQEIPVIGGTKNFRMEAIHALQPDLVVGNKEENYEDGITALEEDFPVWMSDIQSLDDAYQMMQSLAEICVPELDIRSWIGRLQEEMASIRSLFSGKVMYLIWRKPYMAAGTHTFIHHMLEWLGFENVVQESRYPVMDMAAIENLAADYVFLSSEPYPFKEKHLLELQDVIPANIRLVDGEMFSWYGSRLLKAASYFRAFQP